MSIDRGPYNESGCRIATCERCGMSWVESDRSVELLPDVWTKIGERTDHECPEPLPFDVAKAMAAVCSSPGAAPIHPRLAARIRLGLVGGL